MLWRPRKGSNPVFSDEVIPGLRPAGWMWPSHAQRVGVRVLGRNPQMPKPGSEGLNGTFDCIKMSLLWLEH